MAQNPVRIITSGYPLPTDSKLTLNNGYVITPSPLYYNTKGGNNKVTHVIDNDEKMLYSR